MKYAYLPVRNFCFCLSNIEQIYLSIEKKPLQMLCNSVIVEATAAESFVVMEAKSEELERVRAIKFAF